MYINGIIQKLLKYIYIYIYGFLIIKNNNHVALELYLSIKFELCTVKLKTNN